MTSLIKVWQPDGPHASVLAVPYQGPPPPMTRDRFEVLLETRLRDLIEENPENAHQLLTSNPEIQPELTQIWLMGNAKNWPSQIILSDSMQNILSQMNWKSGESLNLDPSELPSLQAILEIF